MKLFKLIINSIILIKCYNIAKRLRYFQIIKKCEHCSHNSILQKRHLEISDF